MGDNYCRSANSSRESNTPKLKPGEIKRELGEIERELEQTKKLIKSKAIQSIRKHIRHVRDRIGDDEG